MHITSAGAGPEPGTVWVRVLASTQAGQSAISSYSSTRAALARAAAIAGESAAGGAEVRTGSVMCGSW